MKTTRHRTITSAALFLFSLGLILTTALTKVTNTAEAQFVTKSGPHSNQMCIAVDENPSCGTCPDELNECTNVIPDSIDAGFCDPTSGSQGLTCEEGCFDCGLQINCQTRDITTTPCSDVADLCRDA